jgi:hypothetical protein
MILSMIDANGEIKGNIPPPKDVKIILKSSKLKNEGAVTALGKQDKVQGMVINEIASIGTEEAKMLRESYPGLDTKTCWILEHGRKPSGGGMVAGMGGGGLALIVVGLLLFVRGRSE